MKTKKPKQTQIKARPCWWGWLLAVALLPLVVLAATDPQIGELPGYVAEAECVSCHQPQAELHARSHHAQAMMVAGESSVQARFPSVYTGPGPQARFVRDGGRYLVEIEGPDGKPGRFVIAYTFGFEPLQQYLVELPGGRLQALDLAGDSAAKRWFWLGEGEQAPAASAALHWSGSFYRWNRNCADCHSTAVRKNFDPASGRYASRYAHTSIGCQACHGAGAEHARAAAAGGQPAVTPELQPANAMQVCLSCHSRRVVIAEGFSPGADFLDYHSPSLITEGLYFADGQIRDEVFEYGSFMQSRMAGAGVNCLDCHEPHGGDLRAPGNAVCLQCHAPSAQSRFGARAPQADFASRAHTGHVAGSAGSACVACHMPSRVYMKVDPRRDHGFSVPRPDLSARLGLPNACSSCHEKQDAGWAAGHMDAWYGKGWRQRPSKAPALAAAWAEKAAAGPALRELLGGRDLSGIARGSALLAYARSGAPDAATVLQKEAASADPLVRLGVAQGAAQLAPEMRAATAGKLLADPLRAIRLASLRALAILPLSSLSSAQQAQLARAEQDLDAYLAANIDTAEAHGLVANVRFDQQRWAEAETAFRRALMLDPGHVDAYLDLAELQRIRVGEAQALTVLDEGLRAQPDSAVLYHARGLALVRLRQLDAAAEDLRRAWVLAPAVNRFAYTYALALDGLGRTEQAFQMLRTAPALERSDEQLLGVELQLALKLGRLVDARQLAQSLLQYSPGNQQLLDLLQKLSVRD